MMRASRIGRVLTIAAAIAPSILAAGIAKGQTGPESTTTLAFPTHAQASPVVPASVIRMIEETPVALQATPPGDGVAAKPPIALSPLVVVSTSTEGIGTGIRPEDVTVDRMPPPMAIPNGTTRDGQWMMQAKLWVPGGFCHQPLYFEDPMLERHGHSRFPHAQTALSGIRFFGTFPVLPYLVSLRHPLEDIHTLGAFRPGTPAPVLRYRPHYDHAALRNQVIASGVTAVAVP